MAVTNFIIMWNTAKHCVDQYMVLFRYCSLGNDAATPGGLHAWLCHAFLVLFSPIGKLAGRAIYFANVFSLFKIFFNGRLQNTCISEANGPIFAKISGLVDGCKGLFIELSFFDFSRDVAIATN